MALLLLCVTITVLFVLATEQVEDGTAMARLHYVALTFGSSALFGAGISGIVGLVCFPIALLIARGLRRTAELRVHVLAFAFFGAAIGALVVVIADVVYGTSLFTTAAPIVTVVLTTASVTFGWWQGSRPARRARVIPDPRSPIWHETEENRTLL